MGRMPTRQPANYVQTNLTLGQVVLCADSGEQEQFHNAQFSLLYDREYGECVQTLKLIPFRLNKQFVLTPRTLNCANSNNYITERIEQNKVIHQTSIYENVNRCWHNSRYTSHAVKLFISKSSERTLIIYGMHGLLYFVIT